MKKLTVLLSFLIAFGAAAVVNANPDGEGNMTASAGNTPSAVQVAPVVGIAPATVEASAVTAPAEAVAPTAVTTPKAAVKKAHGVRAAMAAMMAARAQASGIQSIEKAGFFTRVLGKVAIKLSNLMDRALAGDNMVVAIILWFFLGGLAIHRVYLGTKPTMILWYLLTCSGLFGICPLIDLITMIVDFDRMKDNNKFFSIAG